MTMGVVDTLIVGHVSAADLAGVALGNLYFFLLVVVGFGVLTSLDAIVAQAVGAGDVPAVARAFQRGLVLALGISLPISLLFLPAEPVLRALRQPADVVPLAVGYAHVSIPGVLPALVFVVLRQTLQALGHVRPVVVTILAANLLNAALCYGFVFGHWGGFRAAVGAGIASSLARFCMLIMLLVVARRDLAPLLRPVRREALRLGPIVRMVRLGLPIGAQFLLEFGVFGVIALLMGRLGTTPMAAHQIAINIASLTFMVPAGVSSAAAVTVGRAVGAGDPLRARRSAAAALWIGGGFMVVSALVLLVAPRLLARAYTSASDVSAIAAALIPLAGLFQVFDGLQVVSIGILRGVGDTRTPMIVNVLGFWLIGLPVSLWLAFRAGGGPEGLWWGLVVGLAAVATFLTLRVRARLGGTLRRLAMEDPVRSGDHHDGAIAEPVAMKEGS
jgi:MATE family multidrug resistance protein